MTFCLLGSLVSTRNKIAVVSLVSGNGLDLLISSLSLSDIALISGVASDLRLRYVQSRTVLDCWQLISCLSVNVFQGNAFTEYTDRYKQNKREVMFLFNCLMPPTYPGTMGRVNHKIQYELILLHVVVHQLDSLYHQAP